ncbi:MAG: fibronectin type III domain-containing protein, partial [Candidatus Helarchaeota archaeon]
DIVRFLIYYSTEFEYDPNLGRNVVNMTKNDPLVINYIPGEEIYSNIQIRGLAPGTQYYIMIVAEDEHGAGKPSELITETSPAPIGIMIVLIVVLIAIGATAGFVATIVIMRRRSPVDLAKKLGYEQEELLPLPV